MAEKKLKIVAKKPELKKKLPDINPDFLGGAVTGVMTTFFVLGMLSLIL